MHEWSDVLPPTSITLRARCRALVQGRRTTRLRRAKELIDAKLMSGLSVETIARSAGISTSGLQRLFRLSEGCSVFEYVRHRRLERAFAALQHDGASVQEAAIIAGYAHPANFATAFKRQFGINPRALLTFRTAKPS